MSTAIPDRDTPVQLRHWPLRELKHLHLEMGKQCNIRCKMCYQTDFSPSSKLPEAVWKDKLLPAYSVIRSLTFTGGEPTVMPNCRELIEIIARNFPQVGLNVATNGIRFSGIWEDVFLQQGECVNFSINTVTPSLYAQLMQFGDFNQTIENIQRLVRRKTESRSRLLVRISSVVLDETVDEMPAFVRWAVEHGLDQAVFLTDGVGSVKYQPVANVQKRIAEAYEIADQNPHFKLLHLDDFDWCYASARRIEPVRPRGILRGEPRPCHIAFDSLYVGCEGNAGPCCRSWFRYGNLVEHSLEEVWNGQNAYRFRTRMSGLDFGDCDRACDLNANPISPKMSRLRRGYWVVRHDPAKAGKKLLRKLGITNAQVSEAP